MALSFIGTVGLKLCWTVFDENYTVICQKRMSHGTGIAAEALFDLFGMWFAKEGTKAVEFSDQVKTLGLVPGWAERSVLLPLAIRQNAVKNFVKHWKPSSTRNV